MRYSFKDIKFFICKKCDQLVNNGGHQARKDACARLRKNLSIGENVDIRTDRNSSTVRPYRCSCCNGSLGDFYQGMVARVLA